jgi:hemolysin III
MPTLNRSKAALTFPDYTDAERAADRTIHIIGVPLGIIAGLVLLAAAIIHGGAVLSLTIAIYVAGLIGMLTASAAYQLAPSSLKKEKLRRLDRAMIFVMIAGTYTPISANVLLNRGGIWLCIAQWGLAAAGIFVTLKYPRQFERPLFALYLAMGWMLVILLHEAATLLYPITLTLIIAGGIAYTIGAIIQSIPRLKFHNPIWHALILIAASCQYEAIWLQLLGSR